MSKLFKLREWLTLNEAIDHLSTALCEPITKADIYRLALDKHIVLSVNFVNGASAHLGKIVGIEEVEFMLVEKLLNEPLETPFRMPTKGEIHISDNKFTQMERNYRTISGIWDLTLLGSEAIDLEYYYQQLTSGLEVTLCGLDGVFVEQNGVLAQLLTDFDDNEYQKGSKAYCEMVERSIYTQNFCDEDVENIRRRNKEERLKYLDSRKGKSMEDLHFPSGGLDEHEYVFVIRTSELRRFIRALEDEDYNEINQSTGSKLSFSDQITSTKTWQDLYKLTENALNDFPRWQSNQSKPHNIPKSHIDDWLMETLKVTKREAETIKKIIIEIFNL